MFAPRRTSETHLRRHHGPLAGVGGVVAASAVLLVVFLGWLALGSDLTQDAALYRDGSNGTLARN